MQCFLHKYKFNEEIILIFEDSDSTFSVIEGIDLLNSDTKFYNALEQIKKDLPEGISHIETTGLE